MKLRLLQQALGASCVAATLLFATTASATAAVEEKLDVTHLYNAAHSLTGGCLTSPADPVPDPACTEVPQGALPPEGGLEKPTGVAVDMYGNQYVVNHNETAGAFDTQLDIFDPDGRYIGGFDINDSLASFGGLNFGGKTVAVDSTGHLYMSVEANGGKLVRYDPTAYEPEVGEIEHGMAPVQVGERFSEGFAIDSTNDHLYVNDGDRVVEYGPATNGLANEPLTDEIGKGVMLGGQGTGPVSIDAFRDKIYAVDRIEPVPKQPSVILVRVFDRQAPYKLLATFDGSTTPSGNFGDSKFNLGLAVDESSGNVFVESGKRTYELKPDGTYVATVRKPIQDHIRVQIAYDNSDLSPNQGYLYIPTGFAQGRFLAYEPIPPPEPPLIESTSFDGVGTKEAVLRVRIDPQGESTHYTFELTTEQDFAENGFANAETIDEGDLPASGETVPASAVATGLEPGTAYRFRVLAENQCEPGGCLAEADRALATFPFHPLSGGCSNQALRSGTSAGLPDCRAYELVTPANTGGRPPFGPAAGVGPQFGTWASSPDGASLAFNTEGGALPGFDVSGGYFGDAYVARRGEGGWSTEAVGLTGTQAPAQTPGGLSADHRFAAVWANGQLSTPGTLVEPGKDADYIRYPDGSLHLAGEGSIGQAQRVDIHYIAPAGAHILFSTKSAAVRLEPNAPPAGVPAIYDRTPNGTVHVVSLLSGNVTPSAVAFYEGASADGSTVAFKIGSESAAIYLRLDNSETTESAPAGSTFAGLSEEGRYLFYLQSGDLYRFDSQANTATAVSEAGDVTPVYVSADGSAAYFVSEDDLGGGSNPLGAEPQAGQPNLYRWENGETRFLAAVTEADVKGDPLPYRGFREWLNGPDRSGLLPLRATPDGRTLLFESDGELTDFDSGGHRQVYRYDAGEESLLCLSCNPTLKAPDSDAVLLTERGVAAGENIPGVPATMISIVANLSRDGKRAFFESTERLVPADEDGLRDVYQWEAQGKEGCAEPGGCLYLISSGKSARDDFLYGASETGDDVFVFSSDLLTAEDTEEAPSIYDARVNGGFAPPGAGAAECLGEACQPAAAGPSDRTPASSAFEGKGNVDEKSGARPRCPKGKQAVGRAGKRRCVPRSHKKQRHQGHHKRRTHR